MTDLPFTYELKLPAGVITPCHQHYTRRLSAMAGQYADAGAYAAMLAQGDPVIYEVYEVPRPPDCNELISGLSIVHPGKVGDEYFMTKGHFHAVREATEIYQCVAGEGAMVMETPEGDWQVAELRPGTVLYVAPRWAHRSINTRLDTDLMMFFVCPAHSGHDYGSIEKQGFRKRLLDCAGAPTVADNPRWLPPDQR